MGYYSIVVWGLPESGIPEGSGGSFCSKVPFQEFLRLSLRTPSLIVFPAHFFFSKLFARSTQDNAMGPDECFTCATLLEGTCKFSYRLQYCLQLKNFTVPRVACKE